MLNEYVKLPKESVRTQISQFQMVPIRVLVLVAVQTVTVKTWRVSVPWDMFYQGESAEVWIIDRSIEEDSSVI